MTNLQKFKNLMNNFKVEIFEETDEYNCTSIRLKSNHQFHKEHVDHEGYNDVRNCVPACTNCNSTKKEKTIEHLFNINIISTFTQDKYDKIMLWCEEDYKQYIEEKPPYRIKHSRIYREDGTYYLQAELWIVDDKRNFIKCIATEVKKKDLKIHIEKYIECIN